jgi:hypothetical protein
VQKLCPILKSTVCTVSSPRVFRPRRSPKPNRPELLTFQSLGREESGDVLAILLGLFSAHLAVRKGP